MALNFIGQICRHNLTPRNFRYLYVSKTSNIYASAVRPQLCDTETHDEKNLRLKRPLSPHLTIYQVQLTSMLSVTHRATGIVLSTYAALLGFGTLFIPGGIPCLIQVIANWNLPAMVLTLGKALFAFPLTYHYFNGIRHLAWDMGKFLTIKDVYSTGWIVVTISALAALVLTSL